MLTIAGFVYNKLSNTLKWSTAVKIKDMLFIDAIRGEIDGVVLAEKES